MWIDDDGETSVDEVVAVEIDVDGGEIDVDEVDAGEIDVDEMDAGETFVDEVDTGKELYDTTPRFG